MAAKTTVKWRDVRGDELARVQNLLGMNMKPFDSTTPKDETNTFHAILILDDTTAFTNLSTVQSMSSDIDKNLTLVSQDAFLSGVTFPAMSWLPGGYFANVRLASGRIWAYSLEKIV